MADNGCIGCGQAISQIKAQDQKIINIAKQRAKQENIIIGLYRNEEGQLCIATGGEPVCHYITPLM